MADQAHQRGVSAIAGARNAHALGVYMALFHGPVQRIGHVVLHGAAPLPPARAVERVAIAAAATEFGLDDRVAA